MSRGSVRRSRATGLRRPRHRTPAGCRTDRAAGYLLLTPSALGIGVFFALPVVFLIWLATQQWDLIGTPRWVGADNLVDVVTDATFVRSLGATALLVVLTIPVEIVVGIGLAAFLADGGRARRVVRGIVLLPWLVAPLVVGVIWRWVLSPSDGALSAIAGRRVDWLVDPAVAPIVVAFVIVWSEAGYVSLFFVAGLLTVPPGIVDAARMDGAGRLRTLWNVQLPMMRPVLFFVAVTGVVRVTGIYDQVFALTGGGPAGSTNAVSLWLYSTAFESFDLGRAAAGSLLVLVLLGVIVLLQRASFRSSREPG